jgi:hypothetical protein
MSVKYSKSIDLCVVKIVGIVDTDVGPLFGDHCN